ncbi:MAG: butyrate kinase [bacterium]
MSKLEVTVVINPGSTSTKFALFNREGSVYDETVRHPQEELEKFNLVSEQFDFRYGMIKAAVDKAVTEKGLTVVGSVGRGGPVKPLEGGTYRVNEQLIDDLTTCRFANHASNLGGLIANKIAEDYGLKESYIVDPITTDNMWDKARISGIPGIERACRVHALNIKAVARKIAEKEGKDFFKANFVAAHLGGGISVAALAGGKVVDVNDALLGMGPFSLERSGALPLRGVMKLCYSKPESEVKQIFSRESGFKAYIGTNDFRTIEEKVVAKDPKTLEVYEAFKYQIAKEIGAYCAALKGKVDGIIITGGCAYFKEFVKELEEYVGWMAPVFSYPGENELDALAEGAFRVIDGVESPQEY